MHFFVSEALVVICEFYAKNDAEWWSRELGSRSVNLFPSIDLLLFTRWMPCKAAKGPTDFIIY